MLRIETAHAQHQSHEVDLVQPNMEQLEWLTYKSVNNLREDNHQKDLVLEDPKLKNFYNCNCDREVINRPGFAAALCYTQYPASVHDAVHVC